MEEKLECQRCGKNIPIEQRSFRGPRKKYCDDCTEEANKEKNRITQKLKRDWKRLKKSMENAPSETRDLILKNISSDIINMSKTGIKQELQTSIRFLYSQEIDAEGINPYEGSLPGLIEKLITSSPNIKEYFEKLVRKEIKRKENLEIEEELHNLFSSKKKEAIDKLLRPSL